jgi:hypothetical protein
LFATERKRDKLAAQLTWLANRDELELSDERNAPRTTLGNGLETLVLPSGFTLSVQVLNVSESGAALLSKYRPSIGTLVTLGKTRARVSRHFEGGFAVEHQTYAPTFLEEETPATSLTSSSSRDVSISLSDKRSIRALTTQLSL